MNTNIELELLKRTIPEVSQCAAPTSWRVLTPKKSDPDQRRIISVQGWVRAIDEDYTNISSDPDAPPIKHHLVISSTRPDRHWQQPSRFARTELGGLEHTGTFNPRTHVRQFHLTSTPNPFDWRLIRQACGKDAKLKFQFRQAELTKPDYVSEEAFQYAQFTDFDRSSRCPFAELMQVELCGDFSYSGFDFQIPILGWRVGYGCWVWDEK